MKLSRQPLSALIALVFLSSTASAAANVETIAVKTGEFISQKVFISPGFAVMFQFPEDVTALTLADQTSFSCEKMPTDPTRILCKPLTTSSFATNLVVSTAGNEFNLVLNIDPTGKEHAFKYIFSNGSPKSSPPTSSSKLSAATANMTRSDLSSVLLEHYESHPCSQKGSSGALEFRCLDSIDIGSERYIRFALVGRSSQPVRVIKVALQEETLGGLTGLSIKSGTSVDVQYNLKNDSLGRGNETYGVLKLRRDSQGAQKRSSLVIMTDLGSAHDVKVYGL